MATGGRALVLGGGGVTGIAWETGIRPVVISPDSAARKAIGGNVLNPARRVVFARAGHA